MFPDVCEIGKLCAVSLHEIKAKLLFGECRRLERAAVAAARRP